MENCKDKKMPVSQVRIKPLVSVAFVRCNDVEKAKNNLRGYLPTGGDNSLVREYILNPYVYEPLMNFVPMDVAYVFNFCYLSSS